jgi:polygalacturonase
VAALRREFLKLAGSGIGVAAAALIPGARVVEGAVPAPMPNAGLGIGTVFDVRAFGATGDGRTIDTPAVNRTIEAAAAAGGGTVRFPAGIYACYSIHLRSFVALYLDQGATILAADTPLEGTTTGGYDAAESNAPWEAYQDFGHNHWHNSLIWGENIHDFAILGPGIVWGKGLSRARNDPDLPRARAPGVGDKAIALKNCRNVIMRDFSILAGGHFGILATGVDNLTIDNLRIDTNRDGMNIDCCRNVRVSNCNVNSPWDDAISLKSSFALGYARPTENVTITNCYVTGDHQLGTLLDGTFKRFGPDFDSDLWNRTGRIKFGTESNGGFKNITVSNCVFESCRGLALMIVDGGTLEDITFTGITMRDIRNAPLFLRLGARMRGPTGVPVGTVRRVIISNVTCYGPANDMPVIISGIPRHAIEDIRISDVYMLQKGAGTAETAQIYPPEQVSEYPEPYLFGPLPAAGFFIRHAHNLDISNLEIATAAADARPVFWLNDVAGADFHRLKLPRDHAAPAFQLTDVSDFSVSASRNLSDFAAGSVSYQQIELDKR